MYSCEMIRQLNEVFCFTIRNWSITAHAFGHVRVIIYPAKRSQRLRRSRSETPLSLQEEEKDTIVHQLSTPRGVKKSLKTLPRGEKKSLKSLPRGVGKLSSQ